MQLKRLIPVITQSTPLSQSSENTKTETADWPGEESLSERLRIFAKLFSLYPAARGVDHKARTAAYLEETARIPCFFLRLALGKLTHDPREFAPSVGAIISEAARVYADIIRRGTGDDPCEPPQRGLRSESFARQVHRLVARMTDPQDTRVIEAAYHAIEIQAPTGLVTG